MREFSFGSVWTLGLRFFAGQSLNHAIILVGMGALLPFAVQYLAFGGVSRVPGGAEAVDGTPAILMFVGAVAGYLFQIGSIFASWRLGLRAGETLAGAIFYGLLAGLLVMIAMASIVGLFGFGLGQVTPALGVLAGLAALLGVLAIVSTLAAALLAVGLSLLLGLAMIFGAAVGQMGFAATLVGGSGFAVVLLIVLSGVVLWLAGRLSCTTVLMAESGGYNVLAAMRESWRLTWDDEWRIMRYLALLGLVLAMLILAFLVALGAGLAATLQGSPPDLGIAGAILPLILGVPFAYLTVLVPTGIYRELVGAAVPAEVFA